MARDFSVAGHYGGGTAELAASFMPHPPGVFGSEQKDGESNKTAEA